MSKVKKIEKKDWVSNFTLIGEAVVNDYTFKTDEKSEKSDWVYNVLNLGIDCGETYGTVYAEMMGGYGEDRENVIYAHGKNEDGTDNFDEQIIVAWEDRNNEDILERIGDLSFITVGLEKTDKGKVFKKKFLSEYDAIAYIKEYLTSGMVVNVRGNLKYSEYQETTQTRKNITSIMLSSVDDSSKYRATFTQSVLIDKDSASLKNIDKDKSVMFVDAIVLDYLKEKNGVEIKGQYPYKKQFEFPLDLTNQSQCNTIVNKLFKIKKGYTQITFEGEFIEGGAVVTITYDDLTDDVKELVDIGVYELEEALAKCTANGNRERRMLLRKPYIRLVGDDKVPVVQKFDERFMEEDLILDLGEDDDIPFDVDDNGTGSFDVKDNSMDWLNQL
jgi:hypothetical protein